MLPIREIAVFSLRGMVEQGLRPLSKSGQGCLFTLGGPDLPIFSREQNQIVGVSLSLCREGCRETPTSDLSFLGRHPDRVEAAQRLS